MPTTTIKTIKTFKNRDLLKIIIFILSSCHIDIFFPDGIRPIPGFRTYTYLIIRFSERTCACLCEHPDRRIYRIEGLPELNGREVKFGKKLDN